MERDMEADVSKEIINHYKYRGVQEISALLASRLGYIENQNFFSTRMDSEIGLRAFNAAVKVCGELLGEDIQDVVDDVESGANHMRYLEAAYGIKRIDKYINGVRFDAVTREGDYVIVFKGWEFDDFDIAHETLTSLVGYLGNDAGDTIHLIAPRRCFSFIDDAVAFRGVNFKFVKSNLELEAAHIQPL